MLEGPLGGRAEVIGMRRKADSAKQPLIILGLFDQAGTRDLRAAFVAAAAGLAAPVTAAASITPGLHTRVTFDRSSALASTAEIVRRSFTSLTVERASATAEGFLDLLSMQ